MTLNFCSSCSLWSAGVTGTRYTSTSIYMEVGPGTSSMLGKHHSNKLQPWLHPFLFPPSLHANRLHAPLAVCSNLILVTVFPMAPRAPHSALHARHAGCFCLDICSSQALLHPHSCLFVSSPNSNQRDHFRILTGTHLFSTENLPMILL